MELFLMIALCFIIGFGFAFLFNYLVNKKVKKEIGNLYDDFDERCSFFEECSMNEISDLREENIFLENKIENLETKIDNLNHEMIELYINGEDDEEDLETILKLKSESKDPELKIDEILDKISKEGYTSLTDEQKKILKNARN